MLDSMSSRKVTLQCADCDVSWVYTRASFRGRNPQRCRECTWARAKARDVARNATRDHSYKYNTPCSGGCGTMLSRGGGSSLNPVCRECRKSGQYRGHALSCTGCGVDYRSGDADSRFCSWECFLKGHQIWPSDAERYRAKGRARRALMAQTRTETYCMADIVARDGTRCGICKAEVDMPLPWPGPWSASVDHVVPISKGGPDVLDNVQLAHFRCNLAKSDKLIGAEL
ncbi:HNH endonuclease signature motif containing protein [Nonomuraea sp. NPDC050786]|uniref:HNH endonuclease n=1 Tax=Nonomuraea sp. NPDC050786 TaxID=3154840 RepID=UPI003403BEFA